MVSARGETHEGDKETVKEGPKDGFSDNGGERDMANGCQKSPRYPEQAGKKDVKELKLRNQRKC